MCHITYGDAKRKRCTIDMNPTGSTQNVQYLSTYAMINSSDLQTSQTNSKTP